MKIKFTPDGVVKPVHSVGQPPILGVNNYTLFPLLKEIGVKYSRLHDVGGLFGKGIYVDIPNLFRDFDANPNDPANYDFAFTDRLMLALTENGIEPYFRLGVTIENYCEIKAYRIFPPKDSLQWAKICAGVIRHYTQGWGNGFTMKISHWEIWNEPENQPDPMKNPMWRGDFQQYLELYETASKYLKAQFPDLMFGGYASCGFYTKAAGYKKGSNPRFEYFDKCFKEFLAFAGNKKCPLDFFSFHFYDVCEHLLDEVRYVRQSLDKAGFSKTELSMNEWCPSGEETGSQAQAAHIAAVLLLLQESAVNDAEIYDARCGVSAYSLLFNPMTNQPRRGYYVFKAFNELFRRGHSLKVSGLPKGVYGAAAKGKEDVVMMLTNRSGAAQKIEIGKVRSCLLLDEEHKLQEVPFTGQIENHAVMLLTL